MVLSYIINHLIYTCNFITMSHLYCSAVLVTVGAPVEESINGVIHLLSPLLYGTARHVLQAGGKFLASQLQVLRQVVGYLGPVVGPTFGPAGCRLCRNTCYTLMYVMVVFSCMY